MENRSLQNRSHFFLRANKHNPNKGGNLCRSSSRTGFAINIAGARVTYSNERLFMDRDVKRKWIETDKKLHRMKDDHETIAKRYQNL